MIRATGALTVESLDRLCQTHRMNTATQIATSQFLRGYNCAQSVLYPFRDEAGLSEDLALKIATGLGGGMGRKQEGRRAQQGLPAMCPDRRRDP